ncbi:MAG: AarF/ABC1/UbiB kinase family protein [Blastocatellia bacterium]|nr:AarF/ABC1/UbiB kinase family protein [Blastocatellia bacterium]
MLRRWSRTDGTSRKELAPRAREEPTRASRAEGPSVEREHSLGWRGWWRAVEILTVALFFAAYLYLDALAACDPHKVRGRFRRVLRWLARRFLAQGVLQREERLRAQAVWLRNRLVKLGPTFIKIGQALATRADLLPLPYIQELTRLQDEVPPFPQAEAARILEEELGAPAERLFAFINWEPIASASLGQVYYGRLPSGEEVAIKVQRPRLREAIHVDLMILRRIARFLKRYPQLFRGVDWTGVLDEFAVTIFEEMNYRQEARHAEQFRENFRRWRDVYVPKIYWAYTTERVLTMEYIHGVKVTDVEELRRRGFSPAHLHRLLARTYLKQFLEDGFFHADPHPGNLRVMPDGRLAFFDFGMTGRIDARLQSLMIEAFFHIVNRDVSGLVEDLIKLGFLDPKVDPRLIRPLVEELFREYLGLKLSEIKFKELTYDLAEVVYEYPFRIPTRFTYMIRALMELEGIGIAIDPEFNFIDVARPFAREYFFKREARQLRAALLNRLLRGENGALRFDQLWRFAKLAVRVYLDKLKV